MKFTLCILMIIFNFSNLLFSMHVTIEFTKNHITQVAIPHDIVAYIVSKPDITKIYELIERQEEINRSQSIYHLDDPSFAKSEQQPFYEIQKALFPCFKIMQTCKAYSDPALKEKVSHKSKAILYTIFPQGIASYLLPKITQTNVLKKNYWQKTTLSIHGVQKFLNVIIRKISLTRILSRHPCFLHLHSLKELLKVLNFKIFSNSTPLPVLIMISSSNIFFMIHQIVSLSHAQKKNIFNSPLHFLI